MRKVLVVDDEPSVLQLFRRVFATESIELLTSDSPREALGLVTSSQPEVAIFDIQMPSMSGLELLDQVLKIDPRLPVIFVTASNDSDMAIDAMKRGAYDYLLKPLNVPHIRQVIRQALEVRRMMSAPVAIGVSAEDPLSGSDSMVGQGPAMQEVYKSIGRVASKNIAVLITGESGTGKELVARAIYQHSPRNKQPFLAINCAAIPEALLESELFGHEKGAFTGAERRRIGKFEQCHGGTLFLDEIGDMPLTLQSKMLRVLQEQSFERVGGEETIHTDVRIIAATHRNLTRLSETGQFRMDLYYRLNTYEIRLPSLRDRSEDFDALVTHFLQCSRQELGTSVTGISSDALDILRRYSWPGNVRELQSVLKQATIQAIGPVLLPEFLPEAVRRQAKSETPVSPEIAAAVSQIANSETTPLETVSASQRLTPGQEHQEAITDWNEFLKARLDAGSENIYDEAIALAEQKVIAGVLRYTDSNQVQAAKLLGLARTTLRSKIRQLGISMGRTVEIEPTND